MALKEYQNTLRSLLENRLRSQTVSEWGTKINNTYSPRLDIAVGPFAIENRYIQEYDDLFNANFAFITKLIKVHLTNLNFITQHTADTDAQNQINDKLNELRDFNRNSRCFIAIEIENKVSRKHLMGGAINASVLGRIGIAVGFTDEMHNAFLNLYRYFSFLQSVGKPTFSTNNLLVISSNQLFDICNEPL